MTENNNIASKPSCEQAPGKGLNDFQKGWISYLLSVMDESLEFDTKATILRACAAFHYRDAGMEEIVSQYRGNLEGFIQFLTEQWQWQVAYDPAEQTIRADENKNYCVCPLVQQGLQEVSGTLCHCSEGFAKRMFSGVIGKPVEAMVLQSVLRGAKSCVYLIRMESQ